MDAVTAERLLSLNRQFYQTFGSQFSSTRRRLQPGVRRLLEGWRGDESQLDLGCGNGELARQRFTLGHKGTYTGLDFSLPLLADARQGWRDLPVNFLEADLALEDWDENLVVQAASGYDLVTAFAVLHHIPGEAMRVSLLAKILRLLKHGGNFIHSEWQFLQSPRLKARLQPWSEIGLDPARVDPGDHLMDWRGGGRGLRYVHHFDCAELARLAEATGFRIASQFMSDGETGDLSLYQVWEKA